MFLTVTVPDWPSSKLLEENMAANTELLMAKMLFEARIFVPSSQTRVTSAPVPFSSADDKLRISDVRLSQGGLWSAQFLLE